MNSQLKQTLFSIFYICIMSPAFFYADEVKANADVNLALGKPATQGSTGWGGAASRAVDGNTNGNWKKNSVSHTGKKNRSINNWWQVDLQAAYSINIIKVANRTDHRGRYAKRLKGARIYVGESPYSGDLSAMQEVATLTDSTQNQSVLLAGSVSGRYIVIKAAGSNFLSLAEVEVFGSISSEGNESGDSQQAGDNTESDESSSNEQAGNTAADAETEQHLHHDHDEHMRVLNLVRDESATHVAAQTGYWEEPATWGGSVPDDGARVLIPEGLVVTVNSILEPALRTVRVDGKLSFNPMQNTQITFDTLVVNVRGTLEIGSESQPVQDDKTARLIVADYNAEGFEVTDVQSPDYDPAKLGLGIISMGGVQIFGQEKTPFVSIGELDKSTIVIGLDVAPQGWKVGDKIVITNGHSDYGNTGYDEYRGAEIRRIAAIDGTYLTLNKALAHEHRISRQIASDPILDLHVVNLERNIKIETIESGREGVHADWQFHNRSYIVKVFENRGHVMFMGNDNVSINNAEFAHLGRTSKEVWAEDTEFNEDGSVKSIGRNPRARYALHFHRSGTDGLPALVKGNSVFFSPGWGYVNHGSNVDMINNVAFGVRGASFTTERGDEKGSFIGNFSVSSSFPGLPGEKWHKRGSIEDFGFNGNGFWFHSANISVKNNIANGCAGACFAFVANGIDGISDSITRAQRFIEFKDNTAYNGATGLLIWGAKKGSTINNFKAYAVKTGINSTLTRGHTFDGLVLIAHEAIHPDQPRGVGVNSGYKTMSYKLKNVYVTGFATGIITPWGHGATIENGYFDNATDIFIRNTMLSRRYNNHIKGDVTFANDQDNISFSYNKGKLEKPRHLYTVRNMSVDIPVMGKRYAMYDFTQAADYIPFKNTNPEGFNGLTNTEIVAAAGSEWKQIAKKWGVNNSSLTQLAPGGKIMPENVSEPDNMVNLYLEELGDASTPDSSMPMPEGRVTGSTVEINPTGIVSETITNTDVEGCVIIAGNCVGIDTVYTPVVPADY